MPATSICRASSFEPRSGAKPPSSPTAVASPRPDSVFFSAWKTSAPMRSASAKLGAPTGTTMNSWKSTLLSACAPPFNTFIIGTGSTWAAPPPRYRQSGRPSSAAAACAAASETPRIALAPRRALFGVPSSSIIARSRADWSVASRPCSASASSPLTLETALETPLPFQRSPPSRSSTASNSPVDAPDGTAARPLALERRTTSTSTVGFPRESRIWRAWIFSIWLMVSLVSVPLFAVAGFGVEVQALGLVEDGPVAALVLGERRGGLDARAEALGRGAQRELGVHLQLAGRVDRGEEHVADGLERAVAVGLVGARPHRVQRLLGAERVEAARGCAPLHLARVEQAGQVLGHLGEQAALAAGLVLLDLIPVAQHLTGSLGLDIPE